MILSTALLIAAGISAAAGIASGITNAVAQKKANETNIELQNQANAAAAEQAQISRDTEIELANTAHQREVADLKAAGLNPYASVETLNGAAVPGMASASQSAAHVDSVGDGGALANLASTAQSLAFMMALNARSESMNKNQMDIAKMRLNSYRYWH